MQNLPRSLYRNQKAREAEYLFTLKDNLIFGYAMPNGRYFLNKIKDPTHPDNYQTISFEVIVKILNNEQKEKLLDAVADHVGELEWKLQRKNLSGRNSLEGLVRYYNDIISQLR